MIFLPFNKRKKIKDILEKEKIEDAKKQQILAEIRLMKIQSIIAILTAIGVVIAFIIINLPKIEALFPRPKIRIEVKDSFILNNGKITISKIDDNQTKKIISCSVKEASNWIPLDPGSFHISLKYQNQEVWTTDYLMNSGEKKVLAVPEQFKGNIQVFVKNNTPNPLPGEMLDLAIYATGNGYIYVYELTEEQHYSRIYPGISVSRYYNEINAGERFIFPDRNDYALFAGEKEGDETLLFVVTSVRNENSANEIANRMTKVFLGKAGVKKRENNWGVAKITYKIRKP